MFDCRLVGRMGAAWLLGWHLHPLGGDARGERPPFYEGLHGAVVTGKINVAKYADLKIGVVPVVNLEWIQKIHRDRTTRGYTAEAVTDTILRRR